MDRELLEDQRDYERNHKLKPADDQDVRKDLQCAGEAATEEKTAGVIEEGEGNLVEVVARTVNHFFPCFNEWLGELRDVRDKEQIEYKSGTLIWTGLIMLMMKLGARRQITEEMGRGRFYANVKELSGQEDLKKMPHGDTVDYLFERGVVQEYEGIIQKMMQSLFRKRVFEKYRINGKYHRVVLDGVHTHTFDYQHCEHCLVREDKKTGKKVWMHYKLQASLVLPTGMCLPMASEWIENEEVYDKQDCELKAFKRLIKKLRGLYSRLPMYFILDGLYANEPVMKAIEDAGYPWMVVFKKGSMPEVHEWVQKYKKAHGGGYEKIKEERKVIELREPRSHESRLIRLPPQRRSREVIKNTTYTWMEGIPHWDGRMRQYNYLTCEEWEDGVMNCHYEWLVSCDFILDEDTVESISNTGRCRWHIENEGINTQKNGGYNLKHLYSRDEVAMKIWYYLIDIAHIINQLIEEGSLIQKKVYGSIRNIAKRMYEHFCYLVYVAPKQRPRIQIRLNVPVGKGWWDSS